MEFERLGEFRDSVGLSKLGEVCVSVSVAMLRELVGWVLLSMLLEGIISLFILVLLAFTLDINLFLANIRSSFGTIIGGMP